MGFLQGLLAVVGFVFVVMTLGFGAMGMGYFLSGQYDAIQIKDGTNRKKGEVVGVISFFAAVVFIILAVIALARS